MASACLCRHHPTSKRSRARSSLPDSPVSSSSAYLSPPTTASEHDDAASLSRLPPDLRPRHFHPSDKLPYRNKNAPILSRVEANGYPPTNWPPTAIHGLSPFQPTTTRRNPVTHRGYDYLKEELEPRLARTENIMKDLFHHRGEYTAQRIARMGSPSHSTASATSSSTHSPPPSTGAPPPQQPPTAAPSSSSSFASYYRYSPGSSSPS